VPPGPTLLHLLAGAAGLAALTLAPDAARAQGKLDARYTATLAGVPIGKGAWVIDIADDRFTAAASGMTTGLLRAFTSGQGSSASRGAVRNGTLNPSSYASNLATETRSEELRIMLSNGAVKEVAIEPPSPPQFDRIPLTDAHRRGVIDPMTGALLRASGNGNPLVPDSCNRTVPVFDGRMRFDLQFSYKRMGEVRATRGYQGPVLVCGVNFVPIAGYVPDRAAIKYLAKQRDMEVWLAPLAGTRVLVPFRVVVPTPLGIGVLEATQFVSVPQHARATPTSANAD
jgi:hypothetical protein